MASARRDDVNLDSAQRACLRVCLMIADASLEKKASKGCWPAGFFRARSSDRPSSSSWLRLRLARVLGATKPA